MTNLPAMLVEELQTSIFPCFESIVKYILNWICMDAVCMSLPSMVPSFYNAVNHRCHVWLCPHLSLLLLAALVCSCLTGEEAAPPPAPLLPPGDTALGSPLLGSVLTQAHVTMYTCRVWTGAGYCWVLPGQLLLHGRKRHFWQRSTGVRLSVGRVELVRGDQPGYEVVTLGCCYTMLTLTSCPRPRPRGAWWGRSPACWSSP